MRDIYPPRLHTIASDDKPPVLSVRGLRSPGEFEDVSFEVRSGEVVGFFGLIGAGRSEVMKAIFGTLPATGTIAIDGKPVRIRRPLDAIRNSIGFVTENRKEEGLSLQHSVERNVNCVNFSGLANRFGVLNERQERERTDAAVRLIGIKTASIDTPVGHLSGGNQQKVVFSKTRSYGNERSTHCHARGSYRSNIQHGWSNARNGYELCRRSYSCQMKQS